MFSKFHELKTKEQQATSEELAEHANNVMTTLDEGIRGLDDLDTFFEFIHQVGGSHTRIPGFKAEYFWVSTTASTWRVDDPDTRDGRVRKLTSPGPRGDKVWSDEYDAVYTIFMCRINRFLK